jgi:four helix bundle protein
MATFQRFEDIEAWKRARELNKQVYKLTRSGAIAKDFELRGQLRRASVSAMGNIAEGFGRGGRKEFIQFLSISKGSATEVQSHLYAAFDAPYIDQATFDASYQLADEFIRLITGLMNYLQRCEIAGPKYLTASDQ